MRRMNQTLEPKPPDSIRSEYSHPPVTGISSDDTLESSHETITQMLISMVNHNPGLKAMLVKSIAMAKEINPDKRTNPAQSLEEYYDYIDWASRALPWSILPGADKTYTNLYDRIDQSINYFYFINSMPLEELGGKGLYNNCLQYAEPYRSWLINFTAQWGHFLNTTESWNGEYYKTAWEDPTFKLRDGTYESGENWKTFNQFFARYLSSPDKRPVSGAEDNRVVVSPADSLPQGVWQIDENNNIVQPEGVNIKSEIFNSVGMLLGSSAYAEAFAGGTLTHTFLDVNDYHRYHFPVSGTVREVTVIPGDDAAGGTIRWDAELEKYILESAVPGWQMIETRGCVIVDTGEYGLVAVLPVGMSQVSSVNFEDMVRVGAQVKKGDMLGCFLFGGSDIVMIFQRCVEFTLTHPRDQEGKWQHILTGREYGVLSKRS